MFKAFGVTNLVTKKNEKFAKKCRKSVIFGYRELQRSLVGLKNHRTYMCYTSSFSFFDT